MDSAELKMILEALAGVSGDAKSVLVLFFLTKISGWLINWATLTTALIIICRFGKFIASRFSTIVRVAHLLNIDTYDGFGEKVYDKVKQLKEKANA